MLIIDDLLIGLPVKSLIFLMRKIRDAVDKELSKEQKKKLLQLDDDLTKELIDSEKYLQKELEILNRVKKEKKR